MANHRAALPGAANELIGSSTGELATVLMERLGSGPEPRSGGSRHAAAFHAPPTYPGPRSRRPGMPSRPALAAMSVTAVGAVAAVAATGQFSALTPSPAAASMSLAGLSSDTTTDPTADTTTDATAAVAQAPVATLAPAAAPSALPPAADLQPVQVSKIVADVTATAQKLATKEVTARTAAAHVVHTPARVVPAHVTVPVPPSVGSSSGHGSGVGAEALSAAMTKLGRPYSWGAVGPNSFDCSGLVVWAFKQAGISMPRTAAAQSRAGTAVSKGDLRPGDLVFFYSPVSHVGIYAGNGKVINATQSGEPVQMTTLAYMPFHNARRL